MQVLAFVALWAQAFREEQAEVAAGDFVGARVARVRRNVAAACSGVLAEVFVLAVAAGPFVVPDVEDGACLGWGLGFEGGGVDLGPGGASFAANDLLGLLSGGGVVGGGGGGGEGSFGIGGNEVGAWNRILHFGLKLLGGGFEWDHCWLR